MIWILATGIFIIASVVFYVVLLSDIGEEN